MKGIRPMPDEPKKAYYVEEAVKGITTWLVYANTAAEARETFFNGEAIGGEHRPAGIHDVRRAPGEDRA